MNPIFPSDFRRYLTRKDRIDTVAQAVANLSPLKVQKAWTVLLENLLRLATPENPRLPKFNDLLLALANAIAQAHYSPSPADQRQRPHFQPDYREPMKMANGLCCPDCGQLLSELQCHHCKRYFSPPCVWKFPPNP